MSDKDSVVFVDLFGCSPTSQELQNLAKACQSFQDVKFIIPMCDDAKSKFIPLFSSACRLPTKTVRGTSQINAVLAGKSVLDDSQIRNVTIVIDPSRRLLWEQFQEVVFTPYYNITLHTVPITSSSNQTEVNSSTLQDQAAMFYRNQPSTSKIQVLRSPNIPSTNFIHGFSTRSGGLSPYPGMKSLNLLYTQKKPDSQSLISENVRRLAEVEGFDGGKLHVAAAAHGIQVWIVGEDKPSGYDAIISNQPGVVVAAPSADCTLVLFADPVNKCCGAVHAGWRGTMTSEGVAMATVNAMSKTFGTQPKDLMVAIGPSIGTCCYEFGEEEAQKFEKFDPRCIVRKPDHPKPFVDVALTNKLQLERGGIPSCNIDMSNTLCTKCHPDKFFSYRRDGIPFGNQIGFIGIKK